VVAIADGGNGFDSALITPGVKTIDVEDISLFT